MKSKRYRLILARKFKTTILGRSDQREIQAPDTLTLSAVPGMRNPGGQRVDVAVGICGPQRN